MSELIQNIVNGLGRGSVYALLALGNRDAPLSTREREATRSAGPTLASAMSLRSMRLPRNMSSMSVRRIGTGPTPPSARRTSSNTSPDASVFTSAAQHTADMTSERRWPTFWNEPP